MKEKLGIVITLLVSLLIPVVYIWLFNPKYIIENFRFLTKPTMIATATIVHSDEYEYDVETDNDRRVERARDYEFDYFFELPDGRKITSGEGGSGLIPYELQEVNSQPIKAEVKYVISDPRIARIIAPWRDKITFWTWFKRDFFLWAIGFIFCCYWVFYSLRKDIKKYKQQKNNY